MSDYRLILGDCLEELPKLEDNSIDAIFTDPPYPYIKREYGYWTEAEWMPMMQEVVRQSRRILKPHGSAVFVLQPNSEKVGKMRLWLWRFMVWAGEEWGIVQDFYWWNIATPPTVHCNRDIGLTRPVIKNCIWLGEIDCYRNQDAVLLSATESTRNDKRIADNELRYSGSNSSHHGRHKRALSTWIERGGVTPSNILAMGNTATNSHGAGTPLKLADWWLRYIARPKGVVLDMFNGTGTTGVAARRLGLDYIGIERIEKYHEIAKHRLETALDDKPKKPTNGKLTDLPLFEGATP